MHIHEWESYYDLPPLFNDYETEDQPLIIEADSDVDSDIIAAAASIEEQTLINTD